MVIERRVRSAWARVRSRPLLWLAAAAAAFTIVELVVSAPTTPLGIAFAAVHLAALVAIPWAPLAASGVLLAETVARSLVPVPIAGPSELWGTWVALGALGLESAAWLGAAATAVVVVARGVEITVWHKDLTLAGLITLSLAYTAAWLVGLGARTRSEQRAAARTREQLVIRRQREDAARHLHDLVAGSLAFIVRQSQRSSDLRIDGDDAARVASSLREIARTGEDALGNLRATMILLSREPSESPAIAKDGPGREPTSDAPGPRERVELAIVDVRSRLAGLGFSGTLVSQGPLERLDAARAEVVRHAIAELGTNIATHGVPGGYAIRLRVDGDGNAEVSAFNAVREPSTGRDDAEPGDASASAGVGKGLGLSLLKSAVERQRGTVRVSSEDGQWTVMVALPAPRQGSAGPREASDDIVLEQNG